MKELGDMTPEELLAERKRIRQRMQTDPEYGAIWRQILNDIDYILSYIL